MMTKINFTADKSAVHSKTSNDSTNKNSDDAGGRKHFERNVLEKFS